MTKLTKLQRDILIGTLLGDSSASWNTNKTKAKISFRQKNKEYLFHLYEVFQNFITAPPTQNPNTGVWQCDTRFFSVFRFYKHQFYDKNNVKQIPKLIHRWLTPRVIAYWYMDDGSKKWPGRSSGVRFCTDCFTKTQVKRLAQILTELYGVQTSTYRQRKDLRIYISGRGMNAIRFGRHILPYIHPSMMHKIPIQWLPIEK